VTGASAVAGARRAGLRVVLFGVLVAFGCDARSVRAATEAAVAPSSSPSLSTANPSPPTNDGAAASDWLEGPSSPPSSPQTLPPATAPREPGVFDDPLVVPNAPREDARVVVDDGLLPGPVVFVPERTLTRRELARTAVLDVDSALDRAVVPGLWVLPDDAGQARLSLRGLPAEDTAVVVDGVALVDGGGLVAPTGVWSLLAPASLAVRPGPQVDAPGLPAAGGVVAVEDGGALVDVGESARIDGLLGVGVGGADGEKGVSALVRSGWRTARITAHATLLQRDDLRTGRMPEALPPVVDIDAGVQPGTAGAGGTWGARVDVVPFSRGRLFVAWLAGRTLDTRSPADPTHGRPGCGIVDLQGRALDCLRVRERGADVVIAGLDVRRDAGPVMLQPSLRLHGQRALVDVERSGFGLRAVERAFDEDRRLGARAALAVRARSLHLVQTWSPRVDGFVDAFVDELHSSFFRRSTLGRDAEPPGDGLPEPSRARLVEGARAATTSLGITLRADPGDGDPVALWTSVRLTGSTIAAPIVPGRLDQASVAERARGQIAPSVDVGMSARLWRATRTPRATWSAWMNAGQLGQLESFGAQLRGPETGVDVVRDAGGIVVVDPAPPETRALPFVQAGLVWTSAVADADVTAFAQAGRGALASSTTGDGSVLWRRGADVLRRGVELATTWRAADGDLVVRGSLAAVWADVLDEEGIGAVLLGHERPLAGTVQPRTAWTARWTPSSWWASSSPPFSFFAGVRGAIPQTRLSNVEQQDRTLCPELPGDPALLQTRPCTGVPGFALVDAGATVAVGQLRIDLAGENVFDTQGTWRGALLGSGGQAVRLRLGWVF
jgi:hypothetical protein